MLLASLGLQFHQICNKVPPENGGGTEHASHHGPRKSTQKHVLACQVEPRDSNLGSKVGHGVGGESDSVVVNPVDLTARGAKVVHVTEGGPHLKVLLMISKLGEQLAHLCTYIMTLHIIQENKSIIAK